MTGSESSSPEAGSSPSTLPEGGQPTGPEVVAAVAVPVPGEAAEPPLPVESDHDATVISYGHGGVPIFISVIWVLFILAYIGVMSVLALPDLWAWIKH